MNSAGLRAPSLARRIEGYPADLAPPELYAKARAADFVVQGPSTHGVPGLVNLFGIESPGLTSSLPLADAVLAELQWPADRDTMNGSPLGGKRRP